MNFAKPAQASDPISEAARHALEDGAGDVQKATRLLADRVRTEQILRHALTERLIDGACYDAIRRVCQHDRRTVWLAPNSGADTGDRVIALAQGNAASLLDFPLPGGKRLRDATRAEIAEAADFYERQARDMGTKARWLRLVAQSIAGDGDTAADALSDARLRELQTEAARA